MLMSTSALAPAETCTVRRLNISPVLITCCLSTELITAHLLDDIHHSALPLIRNLLIRTRPHLGRAAGKKLTPETGGQNAQGVGFTSAGPSPWHHAHHHTGCEDLQSFKFFMMLNIRAMSGKKMHS